MRLRSISFALFGASAMFGLLLVAIMAQPGISLLPSLPIPGLASGGEAVSNGSAVARPARPPSSGAALAGSAASPVSASIAATGQHHSASQPASTRPTPAPGTSSPPADGRPVGSGQTQTPVAAEPAPAVEPAPEATSPTAVATAPAVTPSAEFSPASGPIAAGTDGGDESGQHWHQPSSAPPSHWHHGGPTTSPQPPSPPEPLPEPEEAVPPPEGYESSWGGHGRGRGPGYDHGYNQGYGHSGH